jgi:hypothetical protein
MTKMTWGKMESMQKYIEVLDENLELLHGDRKRKVEG